MAAVELHILGPLEVIGPGGQIEIGSGRQRAILTALALHDGEIVSSDRLIEEVWGDDAPPSAHHTLGVHLSGLRKAIGPDPIETRPNGYRLRPGCSETDLRRFEALVSEGSKSLGAGEPQTAAEQFSAALALWRGSALADLGGTAARAEWARLNELRALVLERWIDADLACGRNTEVIPELRRLIAEMPLREGFSARLMLALYRSGRQAEALDVYLEARTLLDRELGVEPGQELEHLQRAVLVHDPELGIQRASGVGSPPGISATTGPSRTLSALALPRAETRRTITAVAAGVRGTTLAGGPLDPEAAREPLDRCLGEMRVVLERHGGTVDGAMGDTLLATFGVPLAHEDDALRAVRAAAAMRSALAAVGDDLGGDRDIRIELRAGIDTGEVVAARRDGPSVRVTGDPVNTATRLEQTAGPGEILLGNPTYQIVRWAVDAEPAGPIDAGRTRRPVEAVRLLRVTPDVGGHAQRLNSPLVGRARERRLLDAAFRQATAEETCQLFTLLGPAGVGKSRLVHEFVRSIRREAKVLRSRCPAYGERVAFWPVVETIRQAAGVAESDGADDVHAKIAALVGDEHQGPTITEHIAGTLGLSDVRSSGEETAWAIRRTFEAVARARPLVIVFDDVQWAEPSFLDLIECIADSSRSVPILLLCIARPDLLEQRPSWGGGKPNATSIMLGPLPTTDVATLIRNLLGGAQPPDAVERRIVETADGNPLFVEELLAMLVEDQVLQQTGGGWVAARDLAAISTPASIKALLAARLDQLPDGERETLERAAVVGKTFTRESVEALVGRETMDGVGRRLATLVHKELIRPDRASNDAPDSYRFKHILIRDAAYAGLSRRERAELHERFADFQEQIAGPRLTECEEVVGYHLEQAAHYRQQLCLDDERTRQLARRAAQLLGAAGVRALQRGDAVASSRLLERCRAVWRRSKGESFAGVGPPA